MVYLKNSKKRSDWTKNKRDDGGKWTFCALGSVIKTGTTAMERGEKGQWEVLFLGKHACGKAGKRGLKREGELVLGDILWKLASVLRHAPEIALPEDAL